MPDGDDKRDLRGRVRHQGGLDAALAARAARQLGVISSEQLYELGFTPKQVQLRARQSRLYRLHHNVYAVVAPRLLSDRAHLLAALLSAGPHSFLSHRTAAAVWGLRTINLHRVELTIPGTGGRRRSGLTVHRTQTEPHPDDVRSHRELRISSVPRLLVELAPSETPQELGRLVTVAVQKRLLRLDTRHGRRALEAALQRHEGFPGMTRLRPVLAAYRRTEDHKSMLELAFDEFLGRHPEIPSPSRNIHIDGWEIDRCWPERRLVVELDGRPYHVAAQDMEKDRIKDAALQRLGYSPIRFTDFRFEHDLPGILQDLHHFLGVG